MTITELEKILPLIIEADGVCAVLKVMARACDELKVHFEEQGSEIEDAYFDVAESELRGLAESGVLIY